MDTVKMGKFLAALRREAGWTQERLGEALGVSGKTVSRWETGAYMPPVAVLKALAETYGVSVDELLEGARSTAREGTEEAQERERKEAPFPLKEQGRFWRRKWLREHWLGIALQCLIAAGAMAAGAFSRREVWVVMAALGGLGCMAFQRNRREAYVEHHLFDEIKTPCDHEPHGGKMA